MPTATGTPNKPEVVVQPRMRIVLTPERIEAIQDAIVIMEVWMEEYGKHTYEKSVAILEDMIDGA